MKGCNRLYGDVIRWLKEANIDELVKSHHCHPEPVEG